MVNQSNYQALLMLEMALTTRLKHKRRDTILLLQNIFTIGVDKASANRISKADFDKINERSLVETQDILMSMIGTIGLISYIPYEAVDFAIKKYGIVQNLSYSRTHILFSLLP